MARKPETMEEVARALVADVEALARVFGFVVPATASMMKALLAGKTTDHWQEYRNPDDPHEVY